MRNKSFEFGVKIVELGDKLKQSDRQYEIANQMIRSGTSIGANIREASRAQSTADFYAKLTIALKEADETQYWLELLYAAKKIDSITFKNMNDLCEELIKMLVSSTRSIKDQLMR